MGSVPRTRGRRFLRPASKKSSRKVREPTNSHSYVTTEDEDPTQVTISVLNAIDHLGNQRFALPPFADHFERWFKDLQSLLSEFQTKIPQAANENLRKEIMENMNDIRNVLTERTKVENIQSNESTKLQQQLAHCDAELSQLEHAYRVQTQEARRQYETSSQKIRAEIDQLDRRRMQILRKNANIFRKIFRKSDNAIAGTNIALDSRRVKLRDTEQNLQNDLQKSREEFAARRQKLLTEIDSLRQRIRESVEAAEDDTLDKRREICQRIHVAITGAMQNVQTNVDSPSSS